MAQRDSKQVELVTAANEEYATFFQKSGDAGKPIPPARKVAIVTCMDARLHPEKFLGASIGDFHMIRNAGGRIDESAIRSLIISQQLLGTEEIFVIHHTDCGMGKFDDNKMKEVTSEKLNVDTGEIQWHSFNGQTLEQSVRTDLDILNQTKAKGLIPEAIPAYGFIYQVEDGKIVPVH